MQVGCVAFKRKTHEQTYKSNILQNILLIVEQNMHCVLLRHVMRQLTWLIPIYK